MASQLGKKLNAYATTPAGLAADEYRRALAAGLWAGAPDELRSTLDADAKRMALLSPISEASVLAQVQKDTVALNKKSLPKLAPDMADALLRASRFNLLGRRTRAAAFGQPGSLLGGS